MMNPSSGKFRFEMIRKAFDKFHHKISMRNSCPYIFRQIFVHYEFIVHAGFGEIGCSRSGMTFTKFCPTTVLYRWRWCRERLICWCGRQSGRIGIESIRTGNSHIMADGSTLCLRRRLFDTHLFLFFANINTVVNGVFSFCVARKKKLAKKNLRR